jgi:hypothetical protein
MVVFFLLHHLLFDNGIHWKSGIKMFFGDAELPSGQLKILFLNVIHLIKD